MSWIEDMNNALTYIEDHIKGDLLLEDIAKEAHCSKSHFSRVFNFLSNMSVMEYVRRRRLTMAAAALKSGHHKVIDIAYAYGYETPEAFTKAFKRLHGIAPSKVKTFTGTLVAVPPLSFSIVLKGEEPMDYRIVEQESFTVAGVKRRICTIDGENFKSIPKFWEDVMEDGRCDKIQKNAKSLGTMGIITNFDQQTSEMDYYIASEGDSIEGLESVSLVIPKGQYAIFTAIGPLPEAIQKVWKKIYSEFFPATKYEHAGTVELEVYLPGDGRSEDYKSEVWIPIK